MSYWDISQKINHIGWFILELVKRISDYFINFNQKLHQITFIFSNFYFSSLKSWTVPIFQKKNLKIQYSRLSFRNSLLSFISSGTFTYTLGYAKKLH